MSAAQAQPIPANISGIKSFDYNQNGVLDGNGFLLPGWTINLYSAGGVLLATTMTNAYGYYNFTGLDRTMTYIVSEMVQPGWHNTSLASYVVTFITGGYPDYGQNEFQVTEEDLVSRMWNMPYAESRVLLGFNHRIGGDSPQNEEIKIFEPLGNWNPGASSDGLSPGAEIPWYTTYNDIYLSFNDTWVPTIGTLKQTAIITVNSTSNTWTSTQTIDPSLPRLTSMPIRDIVIRLHSERSDWKVEVNNLVLKQGSNSYPLMNSPITFYGSSAAAGQDYYLMVRASNITNNFPGGTNVSVGGFTLAGDVRFAWPTTGPQPRGNVLKMDVYVGRFMLDTQYDAVRNFANHINGTVSGYKLNQEGVGLPGWTITCTNETLSVFEYCITDANGYYIVHNIPPGYFLLNESSDSYPGWVAMPGQGNRTINTDLSNLPDSLNLVNQNFTNTMYGNISGYKLRDPTNVGLTGWEIKLYKEDGTLFATNITYDDGKYWFDPVPLGKYTVNETHQPGWMQTSPTGDQYEVELTPSELEFRDLNFANEEENFFGNITGYKLNGPTGTGLPGWDIHLVFDDGTLIATNTTTADGGYRFENVLFGKYTLNEMLKEDWVQTAPQGGLHEVEVNNTHFEFSNLNFTNQRSLCLSGYKLDRNNVPLAGWAITVKNETGSVVGTNTTNSSGYWSVCGLIEGIYNISETMQSNWYAVNPATGYQERELVDQNIGNVNFTNGRLGTINGTKFSDANGNGLRELSDPVLPGWTIQLFNASNNVLFSSTTTDSKGLFVFTNIPQGTYLIKEVQQTGWKQTTPAGGSYTIVVTENAYIFTGRDFGNQQAPVVRPCECPTQASFINTALSSPKHTIQFTDKSTGYPVSWLWKFGDGKVSTVKNPKHTYSKKGTFTVTLAVMSYDCAGKSRWSYYTKKISVP